MKCAGQQSGYMGIMTTIQSRSKCAGYARPTTVPFMRSPNPPAVVIDHLDPEERKRVVILALRVVYELGADRDYSAFEMIDYASMNEDVYSAFWSLLDSAQRARIRSMSELAHK